MTDFSFPSIFVPGKYREKSGKTTPNVYGDDNFRMDGISDKVKRGAHFLGPPVKCGCAELRMCGCLNG